MENNHYVGFGADYKWLMPAMVMGSSIATYEKLGSHAFIAFYKFSKPKYIVQFKTILGQNFSFHLLLGGYAFKFSDTVSGKSTYTSYTHLFIWANAVYVTQWQLLFFCDYVHFWGILYDNTGIYYSMLGSNANISCLYCVAPCISSNYQRFKAMVEVESTTAVYDNSENKNKSS